MLTNDDTLMLLSRMIADVCTLIILTNNGTLMPLPRMLANDDTLMLLPRMLTDTGCLLISVACFGVNNFVIFWNLRAEILNT